MFQTRALQWSGNPYGNGYGVEREWKWGTICENRMDWIGLDLGQSVDLKPYDRHRTFTKRDKSNIETRL